MRTWTELCGWGSSGGIECPAPCLQLCWGREPGGKQFPLKLEASFTTVVSLHFVRAVAVRFKSWARCQMAVQGVAPHPHGHTGPHPGCETVAHPSREGRSPIGHGYPSPFSPSSLCSPAPLFGWKLFPIKKLLPTKRIFQGIPRIMASIVEINPERMGCRVEQLTLRTDTFI